MKASTKKTLVVGELNVDLIMDRLSAPPELGKEQRAEEMNLVLGSSSAIFASNLASLGTPVTFCGKVGADHFGDFVKEELKSRQIDISPVITDLSLKTGLTVAFNQDDDRMMVTYPGAMEHLGLEDIDPALFEDHHHLHVAAIFFQPRLRESLTKLFQNARRAGLTTSLDTQWDPSENWDLNLASLLPHVDYFLPNEQELLHLTGSIDFEEAVDSVAGFMHTLVVKRGALGARLIRNDQQIDMPAYKVADFKDAIGAGDSFNAGFIHARLHDLPYDEALRFGTMTAAVSTQATGGTGAIQSAEQVRRLADRFTTHSG